MNYVISLCLCRARFLSTYEPRISPICHRFTPENSRIYREHTFNFKFDHDAVMRRPNFFKIPLGGPARSYWYCSLEFVSPKSRRKVGGSIFFFFFFWKLGKFSARPDLPFSVGNSGGENWEEMCEARCGEKNRGGVFLVPELPSISGLKPPEELEQKKIQNYLVSETNIWSKHWSNQCY